MPAQSVEEYIKTHLEWETEITDLRQMVLSTGLKGNIKWGVPVYTLEGKNVVGIAVFKNHCALWFYQGALLKKNTALLQNEQEEKTKALRQIRFKKGEELPLEILRKYVTEAIRNQKEGKTIKPTKQAKLEIPAEISAAFSNDAAFETSFRTLLPGKQREYCDHISEVKKETTKARRLEKIIPLIKAGKGLHDKYKNG